MRMIRITCCALIAAVGAWVGPGEAAASPAVGSATAFLEAHDACVRAVVLRQPADSLTAAPHEVGLSAQGLKVHYTSAAAAV